ncbi:MAG: hypothetical protein IKG93_09870 [Clostridiales bacterium]|nr:hypothetical protein [Clostridiales bacterium]
MKNWDEIKNDKELLKKAEALVNKASDYYDDLPDEICEQLNEITGNNWDPGDYGQYCFEWWEGPWHLKQVVYGLFHDGEMPDKNGFNLHIVKTTEKIDMPGLEIRHALCTGKLGEEFRNKFDDLPEKEIIDWFTNVFSGWRKKCKEDPDEVSSKRIEYGEITCIFSCEEDLEYPLDKFVGVSVSHDRTAFVWGEDLSDDEKTKIKDFFLGIGCTFID